jgi:hypothetical protein
MTSQISGLNTEQPIYFCHGGFSSAFSEMSIDDVLPRIVNPSFLRLPSAKWRELIAMDG